MANATIGVLTLGGTDELSVSGTVSQTGAVTIGDATTSGASLSIATGATWTIEGVAGIARGASALSSLQVAGTLIKSQASGISTISLATTDSGLIEAAMGTLDFSAALTGTGALKIDAGAVLEADSSVASTLTATFNGKQATLALLAPTTFAATIAGLAVGDTIDLLNAHATGAGVNSKNQLVIVDHNKVVASLQLTGPYHGATFTLGSDGHGGTDLTLASRSAMWGGIPRPVGPGSGLSHGGAGNPIGIGSLFASACGDMEANPVGAADTPGLIERSSGLIDRINLGADSASAGTPRPVATLTQPSHALEECSQSLRAFTTMRDDGPQVIACRRQELQGVR